MLKPENIDIEWFIKRWHGPADQSPADPEFSIGSVPEGLREWHKLQSRWSWPSGELNRMLPPEQLRIHEGILVFMEDVNGDWSWGVPAHDLADPEVYDAGNDTEWQATGERLGAFIKHNFLLESTYCLPSWLSTDKISNLELSRLLSGFRKADFLDWRWPREDFGEGAQTYIHESNDIVLTTMPILAFDGTDSRSVDSKSLRIASVSPADLDFVRAITSCKWTRGQRDRERVWLIDRF
jgi:hypothetical protein